MKKQWVSEARAIAIDLLKVWQSGTSLPAHITEWAAKVVAQRQGRPRSSAWNDLAEILGGRVPADGMSAGDLALLVNSSAKNTAAVLSRMCRRGQVFSAGPHSHHRYFGTAEAAQAWVDRQLVVRAAKREEKPKPQPVKPQPVKAKRSPVLQIPRLAPGPKPRAHVATRPAGEVVVPSHVEVQRLPSGRDTRFTVDYPITDGFAADWARRRSAKG